VVTSAIVSSFSQSVTKNMRVHLPAPFFFVEVAFDLFHVVEFVVGAFAAFFDALADVFDRLVDDVAVGAV